MKENIQNIQTGLLVLIAATVIYGTFLKDNSSSSKSPRAERTERHRKTERRSNVAATNTPPTPITAELKTNTPQQQPVQRAINAPTKISFGEVSHDFGNIDQNTENQYTFSFTNTGDKPLIIETATGSCGCTVPQFPREPIAPGASSEIKVVYKPGKQKGLQNKTITVIANTEPKSSRLNVTANVQEVK